MTALLLALLLAPPAAALDPDAPGRAALRAQSAVESLPVETRLELRRMYAAYRDEVARRLDQGWTYGIVSDAVIEDVAAPFLSARLLEDQEKNRRADLDALQSKLAKARPGSAAHESLLKKIEAKNNAVEAAAVQSKRQKGICRDWSDDLWSALTALGLEEWTVEDRRRAARPYHTAAVACAPTDAPTVCLAFDPWPNGRPDAFALDAWDDKTPGGRLPAEYLLHGLPEKAP